MYRFSASIVVLLGAFNLCGAFMPRMPGGARTTVIMKEKQNDFQVAASNVLKKAFGFAAIMGPASLMGTNTFVPPSEAAFGLGNVKSAADKVAQDTKDKVPNAANLGEAGSKAAQGAKDLAGKVPNAGNLGSAGDKVAQGLGNPGDKLKDASRGSGKGYANVPQPTAEKDIITGVAKGASENIKSIAKSGQGKGNIGDTLSSAAGTAAKDLQGKVKGDADNKLAGLGQKVQDAAAGSGKGAANIPEPKVEKEAAKGADSLAKQSITSSGNALDNIKGTTSDAVSGLNQRPGGDFKSKVGNAASGLAQNTKQTDVVAGADDGDSIGATPGHKSTVFDSPRTMRRGAKTSTKGEGQQLFNDQLKAETGINQGSSGRSGGDVMSQAADAGKAKSRDSTKGARNIPEPKAEKEILGKAGNAVKGLTKGNPTDVAKDKAGDLSKALGTNPSGFLSN